ncbi:MAG: PIN domain nuclease [Acidobacteriota bacterium]|nr:PIN domain nuclease [Acidobacteriota bacterium]
MILVDSSVWIDYFNGIPTQETHRLNDLLGQDVAATGDLILVEVLQGFRNDSDFRAAERALAKLPSFDLLGRERTQRAAMRYRELRRTGITIRNTVDVVIASFCIDEGFPLLFSDRDFLPMVKFLGLKPVVYLH